jgi:imidazolonepropionase-like amidohydrolase
VHPHWHRREASLLRLSIGIAAIAISLASVLLAQTPPQARPQTDVQPATAAQAPAGTPAPALQIGTLQAGDIVFRGGLIFDAVGDRAVRNTGLVIRNGVILETGATLTGRDLSAAKVVDLADTETLLPGLFDLHAHYAVDLFGQGRIDEHDVNPIVFLANGVTSTFPAGEVNPEEMKAARERIDAGQQIGPRIYNSGPYFGSARPGWNLAAMTPERVRADVDEWAAKGARGFKAKGIQAPQLAALIDQAHKHGLTVTGHLDSGFRNSVNPKTAILLGIDRIEHFMGGDAIVSTARAYDSLEKLDVTRPEVKDIMALYLKRHVYYDATVSAYWAGKDPQVYTYWINEMDFLTPYARSVVQGRLPRRSLDQFEKIYWTKRKEIKAFYDAGGADWITLGTDHPSWGEFLSGFGSHRELHVLVLAGIPPAAALKIGTINGARAIGAGSKLGTLEAGKLADLFVVKGNPLEDITVTRRVRLVMKAGQLYDAAALLDSVKGKLGPKSAGEDAQWKGREQSSSPQD